MSSSKKYKFSAKEMDILRKTEKIIAKPTVFKQDPIY
jgi:hypothetical protein